MSFQNRNDWLHSADERGPTPEVSGYFLKLVFSSPLVERIDPFITTDYERMS